MFQARNNIFKLKILLVLGFFFLPVLMNDATAQVPPPVPQDDGIPIDGLGYLAIAGVLYGANKLRKNRRKKK